MSRARFFRGSDRGVAVVVALALALLTLPGPRPSLQSHAIARSSNGDLTGQAPAAKTARDVVAFGLGSPEDDTGRDVAIDAAGNIYLTGTIGGPADMDPGDGRQVLKGRLPSDIFLAKYSPSGRLLWAHRLGGRGADVAQALALAADGSVYVTGSFVGSSNFFPGLAVVGLVSRGRQDAFLAKYGADGTYQWAISFGGRQDDEALDVAVDRSGAVLVTGSFRSRMDVGSTRLQSAGGTDVFVTRVGEDGRILWAFAVGGPQNDRGIRIASGAGGSIWVTGSYEGTCDFDPGPSGRSWISQGGSDIFLAEYSSGGAYRDADSTGGIGDDTPGGMAIDAQGTIYIAGRLGDTASVSPAPSMAWASRDAAEAVRHYGRSGRRLPMTTNGGTDAVVVRHVPGGFLQQLLLLGGPLDDDARAVVIFKDGRRIVFGGAFRDTVDFDPGKSEAYRTAPDGAADLFLMLMNPVNQLFGWVTVLESDVDLGQMQFSMMFGVGLDTLLDEIAVVVVGDFSGAGTLPNFGNGVGGDNADRVEFTSVGKNDALVVRLDAETGKVWRPAQ